MTVKHSILFTMVIVMCAVTAYADSIRISQVDTSGLLLKQRVKLYLSVTDDQGTPIPQLKQGHFSVSESVNGRQYKPVPRVTGFQGGINDSNGINFLLLIDNSESMYWTLEGDKTQEEAKRRMTTAKKAVQAFLRSISNPNDTVGIAAYNSYYKLLAPLSNHLEQVEQQLSEISRPEGEAIYSEIYASLSLAIRELDSVKGRKAVIILSDGVNNPAYTHTKKINEQFSASFVPFSKPLEQLQVEGISLYVINFGRKSDKKDRHLKTIALHSGGVTFDADNQEQLNEVYQDIMTQVQKEYLLTYQPTMDAADRKFVRVDYLNDSGKDSVSRSYLASSVFGLPSKSFTSFYTGSILVSFLILFFLSKLKFESQRRRPSVEILNAGAGKISTQVLTLSKEETIIGSSPKADMTIVGLPNVEENHATIVFEPSAGTYLLKGKGKMLVNNQLVVTKVLEPGDLINIDGTTMIFDEGEEKENKK